MQGSKTLSQPKQFVSTQWWQLYLEKLGNLSGGSPVKKFYPARGVEKTRFPNGAGTMSTVKNRVILPT